MQVCDRDSSKIELMAPECNDNVVEDGGMWLNNAIAKYMHVNH